MIVHLLTFMIQVIVVGSYGNLLVKNFCGYVRATNRAMFCWCDGVLTTEMSNVHDTHYMMAEGVFVIYFVERIL